VGGVEFRAIAWAAALIEFGGTLVILAYAALGLGRLLAGRATIEATRMLVAQGALSGLSWKLSATLLKTIELQTFDQIGAAFAILGLRHLIGFMLAAETRRAAGSAATGGARTAGRTGD
jgi:hypothetical protein